MKVPAFKTSTQCKYSKQLKTPDRGNKPSKRFKTFQKLELSITDNLNFFYSVMSSPDRREFFPILFKCSQSRKTFSEIKYLKMKLHEYHY